jgi:polysaccharide pyruvyl transferase WcaK-like protein
MNKIVFEGYYGYKNTGDDAFVEVSSWGANKYWKCDENLFLAVNLPETISKTKLLGRQKFRGQNKFEILYHLITAKAFISSGGSTFEGIYPDYHPRNLSLIRKKFDKNFKIGAIGVSIGPFISKNAEIKTIEYLKKLDFLSIRDNYSYEIAKSFNLPYVPINAFDLAALLPEIYNEKSHNELFAYEKVKILGVSICYFERYRGLINLNNEANRIEFVKKLLLQITKEISVKIRFFEFNGNTFNGDIEVTKYLIDSLQQNNFSNIELIRYNSNTFDTYKRLKECNVIISTRLHASVFACFASIPFFLIEYHRKCSDFLESIGYENQYRLYDKNLFDIKRPASQIIDILEDNSKFIAPESISICIEKALKNFTEVELILKNLE